MPYTENGKLRNWVYIYVQGNFTVFGADTHTPISQTKTVSRIQECQLQADTPGFKMVVASALFATK